MARPVNGRSSAQGHVCRMTPAPVLALLFLMALSAPPPRGYGQESDSAEVEQAVAVVLRPDTLPSQADRARAMLDSLRMTADSIDVLKATLLADPDADEDLMRVQALGQVGQMQRTLRSLSHLLGQVSQDSVPTDSVKAVVRRYLAAHLDLIDQSFQSTEQDFEDLRRQRATATAQQIGSLESEIGDVRMWADTLIRYQAWALSAADSLNWMWPTDGRATINSCPVSPRDWWAGCRSRSPIATVCGSSCGLHSGPTPLRRESQIWD